MIAASTSIDYMVGYAALYGGMALALAGWPILGLVLLAYAGGARLMLFAYAVVFLLMVARKRPDAGLRVIESVPALFALTGVFYLPVWIAHGLRLEWLDAAWIDQQGLAGLTARFALKVPRLFGLVPTIVAAAVALSCWLRRRTELGRPSGDLLLPLSWAMVLLTAAIYLRLPTDTSYLVYGLPFLALALTESGAAAAVRVLVVGSFVTALVDIDPVVVDAASGDACGGHVAQQAHLAPHVVAGPVLVEIRDHARGDRCYRGDLLIPYRAANDPLP